jgi:predicted site-specific integrase-resolvase
LIYCPRCFISNEVKKANKKNNKNSNLNNNSNSKYKSVNKNKKNLIYVRVSDKRYESNLKMQKEFILNYTNQNKIRIDEVVEEIGYSTSTDRKKWEYIISESEKNKINNIFVTSKDRILRTGYEWYEKHLNKFGTKIEVVKNFKMYNKDDEIKDLLNLVYVYSYNIPGLIMYIEKMEKELPKLGE